jgi:hypothetical protein
VRLGAAPGREESGRDYADLFAREPAIEQVDVLAAK